MGTKDNYTISLSGGGPWGFRLIGGEGFPLQIAKIRKRSKSCLAGLQESDVLVSINGVSMAGKSHQDAMYQVDNAGDNLLIVVQRDRNAQPPPQPSQSHMPIQMTNGYHEVSPAPRMTSSVTNYTSPDGNVRTNIVTQSYESEGDDGRIRKGYVRQVVNQQKTQLVPGYGGTEYVSTTKNQTQRYSPRPSVSPQPAYSPQPPSKPLYERFNDESYSPTPSYQYSNIQTVPAMFKVKNVKNEIQSRMDHKENYSPGSYSNVEIMPPSSPQPLFRVRDIKGTLHAQVDNRQYSPAPEVEPPPEMQHPPPQDQVDFKPPPPAPPVPDSLVRPEIQTSIPKTYMVGGEATLFPVPKAPYVRFDARNIPNYYRGEDEDDDEVNISFENENDADRYHGKLPIFAPKVEISLEERQEMMERLPPEFRHNRPDLLPDLEISRTYSLESDGTGTDVGTPGSGKKKKLYSDSAFYDDPDADYPTIEQQIDLCKKIARSLTSAANRKARGAKMFAKRKRRANKWIHDGYSHHGSSSAGDIADLRDLDSELNAEDRGYTFPFTFRIPSVKFQVTPDDERHKMSISQNEFECLRLQKSKCDHHAVSPETCHSLVADLQSPRNKGAKLFQKRQARSEKWVIDESNAVRPMMKPNELNMFLAEVSPQPKALSPWEEALQNGQQYGQQYGQYQQQNTRNTYTNIQKLPPQAPVHHDLSGEMHVKTVTGPNFNRTPKGWGNKPMHASQGSRQQQPQRSYKQEQPPPPPPKPFKQSLQGNNYNKKIQAWNSSMSGHPVPQPPAVQAERLRGSNMGPQQQYGYHGDSYNQYNASQMIAASDL